MYKTLVHEYSQQYCLKHSGTGNTQMSIDGWKVKENVTYSYNGILFTNIKNNYWYIVQNGWTSKHYTMWKKIDSSLHIV
jgi:hypothetical protein